VLALALRSADTDEMHVRAGSLRVVGGEAQAAGRQNPSQELLEAGLIDRRQPPGQGLDLGRVSVYGDDGMAQIGHTRGVHHPEIARSDDRKSERHVPKASPRGLGPHTETSPPYDECVRFYPELASARETSMKVPGARLASPTLSCVHPGVTRLGPFGLLTRRMTGETSATGQRRTRRDRPET